MDPDAIGSLRVSDQIDCDTCYKLNPALFPEKHKPLVLDEDRLEISFSALEQSAERKQCRECQILHVGLRDVEEQWAEAGHEEPLLTEDTQLVILLRRGHSLRVTVSNIGLEATFEYYTLCERGM
jgi:hypothetical protein